MRAHESLLGIVLLSQAVLSAPASSSAVIHIPGGPPSDAGVPLQAFVSFSIEFAFFPDYAGNATAPNTFSNNLLNNIGNLTGTKPYIRVGGNTQDYAIFNASLDVASIGIIEPNISTDYPRILTIGPKFFDSYSTWPDTLFIHGFNLGANSSAARQALLDSVPYACKALENGKLTAWELGNEPDLYSTSAQGPVRLPSWNESTYVEQWLNGTREIRAVMAKACPNLTTDAKYKYYAPSFAGTSNHLNPLITWEDDLDADKDISIISSHNYIGGATQPGVTLQGTLMNHTSNIASLSHQLNESRLLSELPKSLYPGLPFILGEMNSLYNEGAPGLSNSFGAALWGVDFNLLCAANNVRRTHMHQGTNYRYASWQPIETNDTAKGTKAPYYGNIAVAAFLGNLTDSASVPSIVNIPLSNEREAAYAAYVKDTLARIIVVNLQEHNATNNYTDDYPRPNFKYEFQVPAGCRGKAGLQRLMASGSDALSGITFDGYSYNYELDNGTPVLLHNVTRGESVGVNAQGRFMVNVEASSAVIVNLECDEGCR